MAPKPATPRRCSRCLAFWLGLHGTCRTIADDLLIRTHKRDARNDACGVHTPIPRANSTRWEFYDGEVYPEDARGSSKCPPCRQRGTESTTDASTAVPPTSCASVGSCVS